MYDFFEELLRPSQGFDDSPQGRIYARVVIAMGHAVIGAAMALLASLIGQWVLYLLVALYLAKEWRDYRIAGGKIGDGAEDTMCVLIGAIGYAAAPLWSPLVILAVGFTIALVATIRMK